MSKWLRGSLVVAVFAVALAAWGCGGGAATGDVGTFELQTSDLFITVKNTAGLALDDIRLEIVPAGRPTLYSTTLLRMENSDTRDISLSAFKDREGASFNLRLAKPKSLIITAKDINGKTIKVEIPWK